MLEDYLPSSIENLKSCKGGELREDYGSLRGTTGLKANFFEATEPKHLFSVFKIYFRKTEKELEKHVSR